MKRIDCGISVCHVSSKQRKRFDLAYYATKHLPLVMECWQEYELQRLAVFTRNPKVTNNRKLLLCFRRWRLGPPKLRVGADHEVMKTMFQTSQIASRLSFVPYHLAKGICRSICGPMRMSMSETSRTVLERFYRAEAEYMQAAQGGGAADFTAMRKTLSPEVVLHQSLDLPFGGEYRGHEGYEDWAKRMSSIFDQLEVSEREFFERGDTVVVVCRFRTGSRAKGRSRISRWYKSSAYKTD